MIDEPLTDAERGALEWLRADRHDRFRAAAPGVRRALLKRGLVLRVFSQLGERYGITNRGREALAATRG